MPDIRISDAVPDSMWYSYVIIVICTSIIVIETSVDKWTGKNPNENKTISQLSGSKKREKGVVGGILQHLVFPVVAGPVLSNRN